MSPLMKMQQHLLVFCLRHCNLAYCDKSDPTTELYYSLCTLPVKCPYFPNPSINFRINTTIYMTVSNIALAHCIIGIATVSVIVC